MTSKEEKNEQYLSDVELFQKFIKDLSKLGKERIDSYQPNDFWDYAFLLSRSFLNDNFHKLFDLANEEFLSIVFSSHATKENYLDTVFSTNKDEILDLLLQNQYIKIEPNTKDYKLIFKIMRNHLSHYNYEVDDNKIIIESRGMDREYRIECSIASLVLLLLAALSNIGQSIVEGANDSVILKINNEYVEIKATKINNEDTITPGDFLRDALPDLFNNCKFNSISQMKDIISIIGKEFNLDIEFQAIEDHIIHNIENYVVKNDLEDYYEGNKDFANYYSMIYDSIKRSTISYKYLIEILYELCNHLSLEKENKVFLPILNNMKFICYLNIVFCSYAEERCNILTTQLFEYMNPEDCKNIPHKIRNSLAHCHYRYQDITDDSSDIIIEFWDEKDNQKNFECKIKKDNIEKLTNSYIKNFQ